MESFRAMLGSVLEGHEVITAVAASQVISNVPAALLLSGFTHQWEALIIGCNLGGLGTLIASMASLISYKQIAKRYPEKKGVYSSGSPSAMWGCCGAAGAVDDFVNHRKKQTPDCGSLSAVRSFCWLFFSQSGEQGVATPEQIEQKAAAGSQQRQAACHQIGQCRGLEDGKGDDQQADQPHGEKYADS